MPAELPETLHVGVRAGGLTANAVMTLGTNGTRGPCYRRGPSGYVWANADEVDWTTVRRQTPDASPASVPEHATFPVMCEAHKPSSVDAVPLAAAETASRVAPSGATSGRSVCSKCGTERATDDPPAPFVCLQCEATPEHKPDPDGYLNREALDERRRGERLDFGARRLAAIEAHRLDLDRKLPTVRGRLAMEVKAALRTWPEAEDD